MQPIISFPHLLEYRPVQNNIADSHFSHVMLPPLPTPSDIYRATHCLVGNKIGFLNNKEEVYGKHALLAPMSSKEQILQQCQKIGINLILPVDYAEQLIVSKNKEWLAAHDLHFLISDPEIIELCHDKQKFTQFMSEAGFKHLIPAVFESVKVPCIVKKREDDWGKNTFVVTSNAEALAIFEVYSPSEYLIQEFIPGKEEYASHILCNNGQILSLQTFKHEHEREFYVQGIRDSPQWSGHVPTPLPIPMLFEQILSALNYSGFCCIDYKIGADNLPRIFEINPRLGASLGINQQLFDNVMKDYCRMATFDNL